MKLYIKILCCCLCIASSACVHAQIIISGVVQNAAENPLQGVNVLLKEGTKHSILKYTSTDTQGKFSFSMPEQKNLYLVFSSIGHEKKVLTLSPDAKEQNSHLKVILTEKAFELNEVVVTGSRKSVVVKEDTIVYRTKFYTNGTEQTVENLLSKLPGVQVGEDGSIRVGGKEVERIMVEGDDFFEKGYKMLSQNMPAYPVEEVEVIQNYVHNRLLKKMKDSDRVALNLKLAQKSKNIWFGNLQAALGTHKTYYLQNNLMNFSKTHKSYLFANMNNAGSDMMRNTDLLTETGEDIPDVTGKQRIQEVLELSAYSPGIGSKRGLFNRTRSVSSNTILKPSDRMSIKAIGLLGADSQDFTESTIDQIETGEIQYTNRQAYQLNKGKKTGFGKLQVTHNPSENDMLESTTFFYKNKARDASYLLFNDQSSQEHLHTDNSLFEQRLNYTYRIKNRSILFCSGRFVHEEKPQEYYIDRFYFQELFPEVKEVDEVRQLLANRMSVFDAKISLLKGDEKNRWLFQLGNNYRQDKFSSELVLSKEGDKPLIPRSHFNNLSYGVNDFYLLGNYRHKFRQIELFGSLALHHLLHTYQTSSFRQEPCFWAINPHAGMEWSIDKRNKLTASYSYKTRSAQISNLYDHDVLSGFRSFTRGYGSPVRLNSSFFVLNYQLGNFDEDLLANVFAMYIREHDSFSSDMFLSRNTVQTRSILVHGNNFASINSKVDYYVKPIKSNIKLKVSFSGNTYENILNHSDFRKITANNFTIGLEMRSGGSSGFGYHIGTQWSRSLSHTALTHSYCSDFSFLDLSCKFGKKFDALFKLERYGFSRSVSRRSYCFMDLQMNYRLIPQKIQLKLSGTNLLNTDQFISASVSDIGSSATTYKLRPRSVMLTLEYRY